MRRKDKASVFLGIGILVLVIVLIIVFIAKAGQQSFYEKLLYILVTLLIIGSSIMMIKRTKDLKKGLPLKDELSIKLSYKAGSYAYISTLWLAVILYWYNIFSESKFNLPVLSTEQLIGLIVLLPAIIYLIFFFVFNKKGDV